ncbi:hypothetical protein V8F20_012222, partial [Naviculisporaceae sp. PSN 640]
YAISKFIPHCRPFSILQFLAGLFISHATLNSTDVNQNVVKMDYRPSDPCRVIKLKIINPIQNSVVSSPVPCPVVSTKAQAPEPSSIPGQVRTIRLRLKPPPGQQTVQAKTKTLDDQIRRSADTHCACAELRSLWVRDSHTFNTESRGDHAIVTSSQDATNATPANRSKMSTESGPQLPSITAVGTENNSPSESDPGLPLLAPTRSDGDAADAAAPVNQDFAKFVAEHFLDAQGNPDPDRSQSPIELELTEDARFAQMWATTKNVKGLILLRKDETQIIVGWENELWDSTVKAFNKHRPLNREKWNLHTAFINCEPKHFLRRFLSLDLNLGWHPQLGSRDQDLVILNTPKLFDQSLLEDLQQREPELVIQQYKGLAVMGWDSARVEAEIRRLRAKGFNQDSDRDAEACHRVKHWQLEMRIRKNIDPRAYLWARHGVVCAVMDRAPGPPRRFETAYVPGSYIVEIAWSKLKQEYQFAGWESTDAKSKLLCRGQKPARHQMMFHVDETLHSNEGGQQTLRGHFNFGLIEGIMSLTLPVKFGKDDEKTMSGEQNNDSIDEGQNNRSIPEETSAGASTATQTQAGPVATTPSTRNLRKRSAPAAATPAPEPKRQRTRGNGGQRNKRITYINEEVPLKATAVDFSMKCRTVHHNSETLADTSSSALDNADTGHGYLVYNDGDDRLFQRAQGHFWCPAIAEGPQQLTLYRVAEGGVLTDFEGFDTMDIKKVLPGR